MALSAAPLLDASRLGERSLTSRELIRLLVASVRSGAEQQQVRCGRAVHAVVLHEPLDPNAALPLCRLAAGSVTLPLAALRIPKRRATAVLAFSLGHATQLCQPPCC